MEVEEKVGPKAKSELLKKISINGSPIVERSDCLILRPRLQSVAQSLGVG